MSEEKLPTGSGKRPKAYWTGGKAVETSAEWVEKFLRRHYNVALSMGDTREPQRVYVSGWLNLISMAKELSELAAGRAASGGQRLELGGLAKTIATKLDFCDDDVTDAILMVLEEHVPWLAAAAPELSEEQVQMAIKQGWQQPADYFDKATFEDEIAVDAVMALLKSASTRIGE